MQQTRSAPTSRTAPVQTFLPYPDFCGTALVLDRKRLGKQRVEALRCCAG